MNQTSSQAPVLAIQDLYVSTYDARQARAGRPIIQGLSLQVHAGETLCIVGESGSGKSVSSLAVMGLLPKDSLRVTQGQIFVEGEDVVPFSAARLRTLRASQVAMVFQEPMTALNPVHKVGKQVEEVLKLHSKASAAERRF